MSLVQVRSRLYFPIYFPFCFPFYFPLTLFLKLSPDPLFQGRTWKCTSLTSNLCFACLTLEGGKSWIGELAPKKIKTKPGPDMTTLVTRKCKILRGNDSMSSVPVRIRQNLFLGRIRTISSLLLMDFVSRTGSWNGTFFHKTVVFLTDSFDSYSSILMNFVTGNLLSGTGTGTGTFFHKTVVFLIDSFNSYPSFVMNFVTSNLLSRTGTGTGTFFHKTFVFLTDFFNSFSYFLINSVTVNLSSDYSKDLALNMINSLSRTGTETGIILYKNIVLLTYLSIVLTLL